MLSCRSSTNWRLGLITEDHTPPSDYKGEKCDGLDGERVIQGKFENNGEIGSWVFSVVIDERTLVGTYSAVGITSAPAVTIMNATGEAGIAPQPDGRVIMTLLPTMGTLTVPFGTTVLTYELPYSGEFLDWTPGGDCKPA